MHKIAIFASQYGTTAKNLIAACMNGRINAEVAFIASHKFSDCGEAIELPWIYSRNQNELFDHARRHGVNLIVLAGWLKLLKVPGDFAGQIVNIHPSLLPKYGGRGMYGLHVHEAVLSAKEVRSGCTVHWVDDQYDHGPIIAQKEVNVLGDDTPETLQERVKTAERILYPEVISRILRQ